MSRVSPAPRPRGFFPGPMRSLRTSTTLRTPGKAVIIALSIAVISACVWMFCPAPRNRPIDRKISNLAVSGTGEWIAAGTVQGPITISHGRPGTAPWLVPLRRGPLNDLQFSSDERVLAVAGKDLVLYALKQPAAPRRLRSDGRNYGTVRFSHDGQTVLVVAGAGAIEILDAQSGATGTVRLWNPRTGQEQSLAAAHPTSNLALGPDGELLTIRFPPVC